MRTLTIAWLPPCAPRATLLIPFTNRTVGLSDEAIMALSRNPPRLILTEDKDVGEWVFAYGVRDASAIFLRYHFKETAALLATLLALLRTRLPDLSGAFTTVGVRKIRIRRLWSFGGSCSGRWAVQGGGLIN